jgi:hypothetical protein
MGFCKVGTITDHNGYLVETYHIKLKISMKKFTGIFAKSVYDLMKTVLTCA